GGMDLAQPRDAVAPVVVAERLRGLGDLRFGLREELFAECPERARVVWEELLLAQQRLEGVATDRERALRLRLEIAAQPRGVAVQRPGRGLGRRDDRAPHGAAEGGVGDELRDAVAQEARARWRGALGD